MRPGVPWNVKGIEAEAREMAQLAARRAGVSLGDWLTQVIMTEGRGAPQQHYVPEHYVPGDGTYGPQPQPQYQPQYQPAVPSLRYPQAFPQAQPQNYQQAQPQSYAPAHPHTFQTYPNAPQQPQYQPQQQQPQQQGPQGYPRDALSGAAQNLDSSIRGSEFTVVVHGLRDLADRLENSERRAQQSIASVNQSVAAMQDRIDAAERVKQLADVAFTSAADALAQSARDQSVAFDSLESTMRAVQKRIGEIENGKSDVPKDALARLETALAQLQKRLNEMEAGKDKDDAPQKEAFQRLEGVLSQLQKRLNEIEASKADQPQKETLARLENSLNSMRADVAESDKRSRDDLTQVAKFMRELSSRVDTTERALAQTGSAGKSIAESVAARVDALESRAASQFDELRNALSTMDTRLAQSAAKGGVQPEAVVALKRSLDTLTARIDQVGDLEDGPLAGSIGAIESTLEALTNKLEDGDRRAAESISTVSNALKSISTRLEDSDKRQTQSMQTLTRRIDDSDRKTTESAGSVEGALKALTQRVETSDKKHKEAIGGLRLTVDGLVAKAASEALPIDSHLARASSVPVPLSTSQYTPPPAASFDPPPAPSFSPPPPAHDFTTPFATTTAQIISDSPPPPPSFDMDLPPVAPPKAEHDGYSVSALQTIMAGTLSTPPPDMSAFDPDKFDTPEAVSFEPELDAQPRKADDFLTQARRAAQAAAQSAAETPPQTRKSYMGYGATEGEGGGRNMGRLMIVTLAIVALVAGVVALLFTLPSGNDGTNRPEPGASINEILNTPEGGAAPVPVKPATPAPAAEFAPLPSAPEAAAAGVSSVAVEPNGLGAPPAETPAPAFTSGVSALPGGAAPSNDTAVAALEAGAVKGDAKSQFVLALRYAEGQGVDKDEAKSFSLVTKAAQQGLVVAEYRLGAMYERGIGAPKDLAQARGWYESAAKGGSRKAMHNLAVLYADSKNYAEAAAWFRKGADYGLADSQYNLAILLERGEGAQKNLSEAAKWYAVAASQGDSGAAERLETLKKTMSPADIAVALDAARKFKPLALDPVANEMPSVTG